MRAYFGSKLSSVAQPFVESGGVEKRSAWNAAPYNAEQERRDRLATVQERMGQLESNMWGTPISAGELWTTPEQQTNRQEYEALNSELPYWMPERDTKQTKEDPFLAYLKGYGFNEKWLGMAPQQRGYWGGKFAPKTKTYSVW
jgi:hypothetical protein